MSDLVETARRLATQAHDGQVDKAGLPYIQHPARVASRLSDPESQAAAWLHDVIEDTQVTENDLRAAGIPHAVIEAVLALTHRPGEPRKDYYRRVLAAGHLAVRVKLADIDDNADPARLAKLDEVTRARLTVKYANARKTLTGATE